MDDQAVLVRGMGYVPGTAQGILRRGDAASVTGIALVSQAQLGALTQKPAGIIVMDGAPFSHTLIELLGFGIPTVIVQRADIESLDEGLELVIDGERGTVCAASGGAVRVGAAPPPEAGQSVMTPDATPQESGAQ